MRGSQSTEPLKSDRRSLPYIYIGKKSGAANVALVNERLGLPEIEDKEKVKLLLKKVKNLPISLKRDLTDEEYTKLYHEV